MFEICWCRSKTPPSSACKSCNVKTYWPASSSTTPRYAGPVSFFRLPSKEQPQDADISVMGVPYDGGTTNRAGTRHGPRALREASMMLRPFHHVTKTSPYSDHRVADFGDCPVDPIDIEQSLALVTNHFARFAATGTRTLTAGGDHLITLPILRALAKDGPVGLIQFDAHSDTNDSYFGGHRFTHGTWVRRAIEERLIDPRRCVQIGVRGTRYAPDGNDFAEAAGVATLYIEDVHRLGHAGVAAEIARITQSRPSYLSFDIDGVDPAFAPGTGTPEVGGFTVYDAQAMLRGLAGLPLIGADLVEVCPPFDPSGGTALVGATLMFEILCLMAAGKP